MPLIEIRQLSESSRLGLWRMDESPADFCRLYPSLLSLKEQLSTHFRNETRQIERLSVHALLQEMTGRDDLQIAHAESGKPILDGFLLSISHTRGYAVLVLSEVENVAVDIEQRSDRVKRIASKFIRADEKASSVEEMLAIWSAKETLYKLFSEDELQYFEMQVVKMTDGALYVMNLKRNQMVKVSCEWTDDYVMTYACLPTELV